jgi:hypothetical protein
MMLRVFVGFMTLASLCLGVYLTWIALRGFLAIGSVVASGESKGLSLKAGAFTLAIMGFFGLLSLGLGVLLGLLVPSIRAWRNMTEK